MNTTLLFFLLLIPLSGFIAWIGDRIGYRIGRRRQSLFGLRPRHTAVLITIASGIGIALASFAGMLVISRSFRDVVARGGELARDNQRLVRDNGTLQRQIAESETRLQSSKAAAARAEADLEAAAQARDRASNELRSAKSQVAGARKALSAAV